MSVKEAKVVFLVFKCDLTVCLKKSNPAIAIVQVVLECYCHVVHCIVMPAKENGIRYMQMKVLANQRGLCCAVLCGHACKSHRFLTRVLTSIHVGQPECARCDVKIIAEISSVFRHGAF